MGDPGRSSKGICVSDRLSPLSQRVRRLLGTGSLSLDNHHRAHAEADPPAERKPTAPVAGQRSETATLFEARITKLSHVLDELRAVDRQREAELRTLREQLSTAHEHTRHKLTENLHATLAQIDALLAIGQRLLDPPPLPPPTTLFERMRSRMGHRHLDPEQRVIIEEWVAGLRLVRERLIGLINL